MVNGIPVKPEAAIAELDAWTKKHEKEIHDAVRGRYIAPEKAAAKLYDALGKRKKAKKAIFDALVSGVLGARGRRRFASDWSDEPGDEFRDISAVGFSSISAQIELIPETYWSGLSKEAFERWDWNDGDFENPEKVRPSHLGYAEVQFRERDINAIVKRLTQPRVPPPPKERLRHANWADWVAAAVIIGEENRILPTMSPHQLINEIDAKLQLWERDPKEKNTVLPTARGIMDWYKKYPPVRPSEAPKIGKKP